MTAAAEMQKLNPSQKRALHKALRGRGLAQTVYVDARINKVYAEFVYNSGLRVAHHIMLGQRGRIVFHEVQKIN